MANFRYKLIKDTMKWLGTTKTLSVCRGYVRRIIVSYYQTNGMTLLPIGIGLSEDFDLIRQIQKETDMVLSDLDACQIYDTVQKTEKVDGVIAEVGVYKGGSAKLIREVTQKPLHLFDTFEGLPSLCEHDDPGQFHKGDYSASLESVKNYLKDYTNISFYKGVFPSGVEPVRSKRFSFVHLDVDIYESTLNCLEFFYPRMSKGGVIISHDYPDSRGVKKAFDEFF